MIVLAVDICGVPLDKPEGDTPITTDSHRPLAFAIARKRVQYQPGQIHIAGANRNVKAAKYEPQPLGVLRLNPGLRALEKEPLQALMPEGANHGPIVTRNVSGYKTPNEPS